jgi:hypothetical protein
MMNREEMAALASDLRDISVRVQRASYYTDASAIRMLAANIDQVFVEKVCPTCGQKTEDDKRPAMAVFTKPLIAAKCDLDGCCYSELVKEIERLRKERDDLIAANDKSISTAFDSVREPTI